VRNIHVVAEEPAAHGTVRDVPANAAVGGDGAPDVVTVEHAVGGNGQLQHA